MFEEKMKFGQYPPYNWCLEVRNNSVMYILVRFLQFFYTLNSPSGQPKHWNKRQPHGQKLYSKNKYGKKMKRWDSKRRVGRQFWKKKWWKDEETATKSTWKNWCPCTTTYNLYEKWRIIKKMILNDVKESEVESPKQTNKPANKQTKQPPTNHWPLYAIYLYL